MKIYFAGTTLVRERKLLLIRAKACRLFSYYHHKEEGMANNDFKLQLEYKNKRIKK